MFWGLGGPYRAKSRCPYSITASPVSSEKDVGPDQTNGKGAQRQGLRHDILQFPNEREVDRCLEPTRGCIAQPF
jgi:hypothetical protein